MSDDRSLTERAYDDYHEQLSLREQVYVLRRLGRQDEALALARTALASPALPERDRSTLEADARALSEGISRYVRASGDTSQMQGLFALRSAAGVEYAGPAAAVRGDVSFTQYRPSATADRVLTGEARDVAGSLRGRLGVSALELGVRARDESTLRPFGAFALQLAGKPDAGAQLRVHVDDLTTDTTRLRALGVRDAVVLDTALPFGEHVFLSARAAGETFYTQRERGYLGAGLTFDAGLGTSFRLPADVGVAGFRLVGRAASRFARSPSELAGSAKNEVWLPGSSEWAGVGASLGKGKLDAPPLIGRQFCYVLDAAAGWLWPTSTPGFSAQAGVGVSVFGADLLTLAARGGNVVGGATWGASLGYGFTIDR